MATIDYEKKYKALVEAVKTLKEANPSDEGIQNLVKDNVPELAESEDERIRKAIRTLILSVPDIYEKIGFSQSECFAWLEKQGEHAKFRDSIQVGDKVTRNEDGVLVNLSQLNRVAKKKGEQKPTKEHNVCDFCEDRYGCVNPCPTKLIEKEKPADKVEPKFHEGEWIIHHGTENIYQVVARIDNQYQLKYGDNYTVQKCADVDRCARLWDVTKDAKDGDVLVASDGSIFLFKGTSYCACKHYAALTTDNVVKFNEGLEHYWENSRAVYPATKKQRDTLMKAMADAGYTFDFEKKELKKIVVPIFKVGDTIIKKHNSDILYFGSFVITDITGGKYWYNDRIICDITEQDEWEIYEPVSQKSSEWSEEDDEHLERILKELENQRQRPFNRPYLDKIESDYNWLKSLKDRVQPEQEWSEEDKKMLKATIGLIEVLNRETKGTYNTKEYINFLKSLRPQSQWKPSKEQMLAINTAINVLGKGTLNGKQLIELQEQLKKLK